MPYSDIVADLLTKTAGYSSEDVVCLRQWIQSGDSHCSSVYELLLESGVLQPNAIRTLDLIRKGFLAPADARVVLAPNAEERFRTILALIPPQNRTVSVPTQPPELRWMKHPEHPTTSTSHDDAVPFGIVEALSSPVDPEAGVPTTSISTAAVPGVGSVLGKCLLTGILGKGGHGVVYMALHQSLNITVAVKVLLSPDGRPADNSVRMQLRHEAQMLARLNHPNVIRVLDYDDGPVPFVVMEYVEGPSLADLIHQTGSIRADRALDLLYQCVLGLNAAWDLKIVHRDIKPGNILLTRSGIAKLADLGLALASKSGGTRSAENGPAAVGTCAYMAPEQARAADHVDFRADMYSLGATFYHVLTGRMPFAAKTPHQLLMMHAIEPVIPPHLLSDTRIDQPISELIVRLMAKDPYDRFDSYEELLTTLTGLAAATPEGNGGPSTPPMNPDPQTQKASGLIGRLLQFRK